MTAPAEERFVVLAMVGKHAPDTGSGLPVPFPEMPQPAGRSQPYCSAISLQVGHTG